MIEKVVKDLEYRLQLQELKLQSLLEITNNLHHNFSLEKVTHTLRYVLKDQLGFSKFVVIYFDEIWDVFLKVGYKGRFDIDTAMETLHRFKEITIIESSPNELLDEFDVVVPVYHEKEPIAYLLLTGLEREKLHLKETLTNISFIQTIVNVVVMAIQNRKMVKMEIAQETIKKELELASLLQKMLFPSDLPSNVRMDVSAKYIQRHKVGGDYYDFIPLEEDNYALCIADVSGKGISAAMLMSNFQASVRTLFSYQRFELDFLVKELNKTVIRSSKGEKFITFFVALYNAKTRELSYVNAGHNYPILTNGRKYELLTEGTIGLGMLDDLPFINVGCKVLPNNTTLVLYTDGVVELPNKEGEHFEIERLVRLVHNYYPLKMEDMNNLIFSKLEEWHEGSDLADDTAIFSCRFF